MALFAAGHRQLAYWLSTIMNHGLFGRRHRSHYFTLFCHFGERKFWKWRSMPLVEPDCVGQRHTSPLLNPNPFALSHRRRRISYRIHEAPATTWLLSPPPARLAPVVWWTSEDGVVGKSEALAAKCRFPFEGAQSSMGSW